MNQLLPPEALLRNAATLIERAIDQLNKQHGTCGECGMKRFDNQTHARAWERVKATPEKLRAAALFLVTDGHLQTDSSEDDETDYVGKVQRP